MTTALAHVDQGGLLATVERARAMLEHARTIDDIRHIRDIAEAARAYAKAARLGSEAVNHATLIKIDAERKAGQLLAVTPKHRGFPDVVPSTEARALPPTLSDMGITYDQSSDWQALARLKDDEYQAAVEAVQGGQTLSTGAVLTQARTAHVGHATGEHEWYTPSDIVEAARAAMGSIDCDPASSEIANRTVKAPLFFTKEQDGLGRDWGGNVFLNPPYAQPLIAHFSETVSRKFADDEIEQACVLVNNATETAWFAAIAEQASAVCFPSARVRFLDPNGMPGAPLQGQAMLYLGPRRSEFSAAFAGVGIICHVV